MKHESTLKHLDISAEQRAAALAAAPERASGPEYPYDPNDAAAVKNFWAKGRVRLPGQRGPQKSPVKVSVTVRYSPEVVEFFKATGEGWQTRMDDVLKEYVIQHQTA